MSTKAIIGIIAAIAVVGAGAWYVFTMNGGDKAGSETGKKEAVAGPGAGTFAEIIGRAGSWQCDVKTNVQEAPSEGTAYIADGKVRADFTSVVSGQTFVSHMISADGYVYTWSDAYPQGVKMPMPELSEEPAQGSTAGLSYHSQVDYDCAIWGKDETKFVPPSTVTFTEIDTSAGVPQPN